MDAQAPRETEERLQRAADVCAKAGAELVYLFGSQVSGKVWRESDGDLGVLLGPEVGRDRQGAVGVELISALMSVVESNKVNVAILTEVRPLLTYEGSSGVDGCCSSGTGWPKSGSRSALSESTCTRRRCARSRTDT